MRVLVLVLAVFAVSCSAFSTPFDLLQKPIAGVSNPDPHDGRLVSFLENLKKWMQTGNAKPAIPVLDPLKNEHLEFNVDNQKTGITVQATLDNLRALGLSDFVVNKGDFTFMGLEASVDLTWKNIDLFAMYKLIKAKIPDPLISFHGEGAVLAILKNLQVAVVAKLSMNSEDKLYVRELDLKVQLEKFVFNATGLLDDEELSKVISKIVSDLIPQVVRDFSDEISKQGGEILKKVLDQILGTLTMSDLIDIIGK